MRLQRVGLELLGQRAGQRSLRVLGGNESRKRVPPRQGLVAEVRGVNIHAETVVDGRDRKRLERLCRYIARPAIAQDRLEQLRDGRLRYAMKRAWSDRTSALIFEPMSLMARLVALIPPPRFHLLRFAGVLSAHATLRRHVVPRTSPVDPNPQSRWQSMLPFTDAPALKPAPPLDPAELSKALGAAAERAHDRPPATPSRHLWAELMRHVFEQDVLRCVLCEGRMGVAAIATTPKAIARVLAQEGHAARPPPQTHGAGRGQRALEFG